MLEVLNYNFDAGHIADENFEDLYTSRRRDSTFAFVYRKGGSFYAIRDHLGTVPLYYRFNEDGIEFSTNFTRLVQSSDTLNEMGLRAFVTFGTLSLFPLVDEVMIVPPGSVVQITPERQVRLIYQYTVKPRSLPLTSSLNHLAAEFAALFEQAVRRLIKHDVVGLYLSGGADSALIGVYLNKAGVRVHGYTSAPWGKTSSEIPYAQRNAELVAAKHEIDYLEAADYPRILPEAPRIYGDPIGSPTALGVASMWQHTSIASEKQLFLGQNNDTVMCAMPAQYLVYFANFLPGFFRKRLHPTQQHRDLLSNFLAFTRSSEFSDPALWQLPVDLSTATRIQVLILAGMYMVWTPIDSQTLTRPAFEHDILISNPYYDMDLIEFALGIPLRHRITVSRTSKTVFALEKRVFQQIARRDIPDDVLRHKKGFVVSFDRDEQTRVLAQAFPATLRGIPLKTMSSRFAAGILRQWADIFGLTELMQSSGPKQG